MSIFDILIKVCASCAMFKLSALPTHVSIVSKREQWHRCIVAAFEYGQIPHDSLQISVVGASVDDPDLDPTTNHSAPVRYVQRLRNPPSRP